LEAVCIDSLFSEFKGTPGKNNLRFIAIITKFLLVNELVKNRSTSPYIAESYFCVQPLSAFYHETDGLISDVSKLLLLPGKITINPTVLHTNARR